MAARIKASELPKGVGVPEKEVLRACLHYLELLCVPAWRNNVGGFVGEYKGRKRFVRFGVPGLSDIIGIIPFEGRYRGALLAVECKGTKGRLRPEQEAFLELVRSCGGVAVVVRSVSELVKEIDEIVANS